ncbi:MAG: NAD-dependent protein deacylase [Planctomycetota bacterium]|nr:MAG: NAD-dependent protein deacylase [Planctomycetota bacterium]REK20881.1 MAG: NAD-dependent protein deacylase [Planctomycetota bacterium]REK32791.1 MAG: NAD-dependent protein deacylase [Planctomycetota bacterium]
MTAPAQLAAWISEARSAVAFTGAGISTESGIPDFRSPGGVWSRSQPVYFDEFLRDPAAREEYWRQKAESHRDFREARPNIAHEELARWEESGRLVGVITQNIDGLHQVAGSRTVWELHGTAREIACLECTHRENADRLVEQFIAEGRAPDCPRCGGLIKHATISFGQALPEDVLLAAAQAAQRADLFITIGSSLVVTPAANLPVIAKQSGAKLVIINRDATPLDSMADLVINAAIGETFRAVRAEIQPRVKTDESPRRH